MTIFDCEYALAVPGIPFNFVDRFSDSLLINAFAIGIVSNEILRGNRREEEKNMYSLSNPTGLILVKNLTELLQSLSCNH